MSEEIVHRGLRLDVKCRDCLHLKRTAHSAIGKACITLGVEPYSKPCKRFQPSPFVLEVKSNDLRAAVTHLLTKIKDGEISTLAALINNEKKTRAQGFCYGQTVFVQLNQRAYLSNWSRATILSADKEYVYVRGAEGYVASFKRSSIRTVSAFAKLKTRYLKAGKLRDPESYSPGVKSDTATEMKKESYKPKLVTKAKEKKSKAKPKGKKSVESVTVRGGKSKTKGKK